MRGATSLGPRVAKADEEVRQAMEKDALFLKYSKSKETGARASDDA